MNRSTMLPLIAVALAVYGMYIARYVPGMLTGPSVPALLVGFILQAVCAFMAALGVWRGARWAAGAVVLLGVSMAATWLFEGFILGIVAYLRALLLASLAAVTAFIIAAYVRRQRAPATIGATRPASPAS
jgi:hypothetical protein